MLIEDFLFTEDELKTAKSRQLLPCKCHSCGKVFYKPKNWLLSTIKAKLKHVYCSIACCGTTKNTKINTNCEYCGKEISKNEAWFKITKHHFCSQSCAAKYRNAHKTSGFRRSKLEIYLESRLTELYPDLEILYNDRQTLGNGLELDIYVPSKKMAFELNGIFHIIPVFGQEKLDIIQDNDSLKLQKCQELNIILCVIDVSREKGFTEKRGQKYLDIIKNFITSQI